MSKQAAFSHALRTLTAPERTDFERTRQALYEQLQRTHACPTQPVRMRLVLWILHLGLETNRADFDLLDRLCGSEETELLPDRENQP